MKEVFKNGEMNNSFLRLKVILFSIFLISHSTIVAQSSLVAATGNNFIYKGIENSIQVEFSICDYDSFTVVVSDGIITRRSEKKYIWFICEANCSTSMLTLSVFKKGQVIYKKQTTFFLLSIPDPRPLFYDLSHYSRRTLSEKRGLRADMEDFIFDVRVEIISYQLRLIRKEEVVAKVENKGSRFSKKTRDLLKKMKKGDRLIITKILAQCPCEIRELEEMVIEK